MESTAIATTMPPGRYGVRHITQWSIARTVLDQQTPWSSPSPSCENTNHKNKKLLLASGYRTFLLPNGVSFGTKNGPSTQHIVVTSFV